ncbi:MAG: hypothetical protein ABI551_01485 [Polyangiaceae bacterium]
MGAWLVVVGTTAFAGCGDASDNGSAVIDGGLSASDAGAFDDGATPHDAGADAATPLKDAGPPDPCGTALFCETFDGYGGVTTIADKQKFGPWTASLKTGAVMSLDGAHTTSGATALHVHIDNAATAGGRLYASAAGGQAIFAGAPTHLYGRMKMYIDPNGTSIHWTFFGVDGPAATTVDGSAGRNASYVMSSLPKSGVNTYSFVYGLSGTPSEGDHDCSSQSATSMPSAWACVSFEMDSSARKLRMYKDGVTTPILSVDDHGKGCVAPTPATDPWYGPAVTDLFVGAYSFHAMDAPLDVWIDDLVVDTKPVACP